MIQRWPRIRVHDDEGSLVLREGLVICFAMRRSHREVGADVMSALDAYCRAIHPKRLELYPHGDDWLPLDEKVWGDIRQEMLATAPHAGYYITLVEDDDSAGSYYFNYQSMDLELPPEDLWPHGVTTAVFHLPTEYLEEHGPGRVRALALEMAQALPFSFGYVSLAFLNPVSYWYIDYRHTHEFCFRYPGLDIYDVGDIVSNLGTRARGAYWLTFLGQPLLGQFGGVDALRQRLPSPDISFQPLPGERLLLTLGEWPEAGDAEKGDMPPSYRELARVLEPHLYEPTVPYGGLSLEQLRLWLRRFTTEPSAGSTQET